MHLRAVGSGKVFWFLCNRFDIAVSVGRWNDSGVSRCDEIDWFRL